MTSQAIEARATAPKTAEEDQIAPARSALERGDLAEALIRFTAAGADNPDHIGAQLGLGETLQALERPAEAEEVYRRLVERRPNNIPARLRLGRIARGRGDLSEALTHFKAAAAADPEKPTVQLELASVLEALDRQRDAEAVYRRIVDREPENFPARARLGKIALDRRQWVAALTHFEAASANDAGNLAIQLGMGSALEELEHRSEAEAVYRRVLERDPGNFPARARLGRMALARRDWAAALSHFEAAAAGDPSAVAVQLGMGSALENLDRWPEAQDVYRRVIEHDPQNGPARARLERMSASPSPGRSGLAKSPKMTRAQRRAARSR